MSRHFDVVDIVNFAGDGDGIRRKTGNKNFKILFEQRYSVSPRKERNKPKVDGGNGDEDVKEYGNIKDEL